MFGGEFTFVEDEDGLFTKYRLPKGKRLENGDKINIQDCEPIGKFRAFGPPKEKDFSSKDEWRVAMNEYSEKLESDDDKSELCFFEGKFLFLLPIED